MKLTAENVDAVYHDCTNSPGDAVTVQGAVSEHVFCQGCLRLYKDKIVGMLEQLPDTFKEGQGGGMSFLNACMDRDGNQWGEQFHVEKLLALGIGVDYARILKLPGVPEEMMRSILPGGMPYFSYGPGKVMVRLRLHAVFRDPQISEGEEI